MKTLLAAALLAGCSAGSVGAPVGFSNGESWTAPMIGPLEDGLILVPVFINGKGPYTFAVDTDANYSVVTRHILSETGMQPVNGPKMDDESGTHRDRLYAEVLGLEVGTLTVESVPFAEVVIDHAFDIDGRTIDGLLGRDVILDSLAFEFDRDRGMITLTTQNGFKHAVTAFSAPPSNRRSSTRRSTRSTTTSSITRTRLSRMACCHRTNAMSRAGSSTPVASARCSARSTARSAKCCRPIR